MKKGIIALAVVLGLVGCQSKNTQKSQAEALELTKSYGVSDEINFEIVKSEVTDQIAPTNKNKTYKYIKAEEQNIFINVVMKVTNMIDSEKELNDIFSGQFRIDQQTYPTKLAIETVNYNQISTTDTLKAKETRYIHIYSEIPKNQVKKEATLNLKALNITDYDYVFLTERTIMNHDVRSIGDSLTLGQSEIVLKSIIQTKKLEPSVKGFFYSYIPTDNSDETFVALQIDIKNTTEHALNPSDYIYCEYEIDETVLKSQIIMETEDHQSISKLGDIPALSTRTIYLAMSVKDSLLNEDAKIQLYVEGQTFEVQK